MSMVVIVLTGTVQAAGWFIEIVDNITSSGRSATIAIINNQPAMAYFDGSYNIRYAQFDGDSWQVETITTSTTSSNVDTLSLAEVNGQPAISYGKPHWGRI